MVLSSAMQNTASMREATMRIRRGPIGRYLSVSPPLLGSAAAAASVSLLPTFKSVMASEEIESGLPPLFSLELSSRALLAKLSS